MKMNGRFVRVGTVACAAVTLLTITVGCMGRHARGGSDDSVRSVRTERAGAELQRLSLRDQGVNREFFLYVPGGRPPPGGWPLVIALHGGQGNGEKLAKQTGFTGVADRNGFAVVFPNSDKYWNDGRDVTANGVNDVTFIANMLDFLQGRYGLHREKVFVTGISNGGMMTYRLACELNHRIAGFAPISASFPASYASSCRPGRAVPLMALGSPEDPILPWQGGEIKSGALAGAGGRVIPVADTIAFWRKNNLCSGEQPARRINARNDGTDVKVVTFSGCQAPLVLVSIDGGGHVWPGATEQGALQRRMVGKSTEEIDGAEYTWQFFRNLR